MLKLGTKIFENGRCALKLFNYNELDQDLFVPEIINLISAIHEYKGKQELYINAQPDILKGMLQTVLKESTHQTSA